jgi:hypothetical protein
MWVLVASGLIDALVAGDWQVMALMRPGRELGGRGGGAAR